MPRHFLNRGLLPVGGRTVLAGFVTMPVLLLLLVFSLAAGAARAALPSSLTVTEAQTLFRRANEQYQKQNYPEARNLYFEIVQGGIQSPEVYYNLANTAARLGRVGEAVLYYERARELAPRDGDVAANLQRVAPAGNDPQPFVLTVPFHWLLNRFSQREWMGAFLFLFLATGVVGGLLLSRRLPAGAAAGARPAMAGMAILTFFVLLFAGTRYYQTKGVLRVITMKPDTVIRSGPSDNYSQLVSLPEGSKLQRLHFTDDPKWAHVALPSGQTGYTLVQNLQSI